ncbi:MAG: trigger factor, partial [Candidatus Paceibacteria bacterium]
EAPVDVVKKSVGEAQFDAELKNTALNETYQQALQQENIDPLGQPEVDVTQEPYQEGELSYSVTVSVMPEFELPNYKEIAKGVEYEEPTVEEDDIEQTKQQILLSRASYTSKEEAAEEGDNVVVDFRVDKDGETLDQAEQYSIRLGDNQCYVPGGSS